MTKPGCWTLPSSAGLKPLEHAKGMLRISRWLLAMALGVASAPMAAAADAWPGSFEPLAMPFRPHDKMICRQNPPDFSWPALPGADGYALQVARDAAFQRVVHEKPNLAVNLYNFPRAFEAGTWYWRVRFHNAEGWSAWTSPRRFRIETDALPFPVPPVERLMERVPAGHPRVWTTQADLKTFRARASGPRKEWFAKLERQVRADIAKPPAPEPLFPYPDLPVPQRTAEWIAAWNRLRSEGEGAAERLFRTAFVYLVTGDRAVGASAVDQMMNMARWDPAGATSYATHDQVHRAVAWKTAVAYDWCHGLLTPEQRRAVLGMVRARTLTMFGHLVEKRPLTRSPYDSHGWTAYGYMGIIAIATLTDLPEAEHWFRSIAPSYINLLPPWGGEDGGWAQGTAYWQYSQQSNKEFMDVLLSATGFSLYDKACIHGSGLFPLYTLPHGSPRGHFGDGTEHRPGLYQTQHYRRLAQVHRNPVLQWAWQAIGGREDTRLNHYFSGDESLPARPPNDLPPARWFRDIGWVAMHSDLIDPERISLYFKSSPMGSFNHSHADQNGFVLNAYGEALAIDAGYYDWYGSPHDKNYTRQTLAHNAVTHDGGLGQPIFDVTAKGRIAGFVTHGRFDACTGDATAAYMGALARAVRHIIYVRPGAFVVIDDLAAADGKASTFEWWLNALSNIRLDGDGAGATVEQGKARLKVRLHGPEGFSAAQSSEFIGPPNVYAAGEKPRAFPPQGPLADRPGQVHARFATAPTDGTRIVATLQPYREGGTVPGVRVERDGGALCLRFPGGEQVFVRMSGRDAVRAGGIVFDGAAAAVSGDAVLLLEGTRIERDGKLLLSAEKAVTAVVSPGALSVSSGDDARIRLQAPGVTWVRDARGHALSREMWSTEGNSLLLRLEPAWHSLQVWREVDEKRPADAGPGRRGGRRGRSARPPARRFRQGEVHPHLYDSLRRRPRCASARGDGEVRPAHLFVQR